MHKELSLEQAYKGISSGHEDKLDDWTSQQANTEQRYQCDMHIAYVLLNKKRASVQIGLYKLAVTTKDEA